MTLGSIAGSLIAPFPTLSAAVLGALAAFLGAGISGVSLVHVGAGQLAADDGARWGTLVGGAAAFVTGVGVLVALRLFEAPRDLFARTAAWNAAGVVLAPALIAAGAWVGAVAGAGGDHLGRVIAALPELWPVAACLGLLGAATGLLATTRPTP